ncbi:MAG TPA: UDP-N-acetylglucosamine 2-epimerase (non-hydrolyzing) [Streptosporangiaceae bacterium]|nr:UDP-N-acetylglucosamine 2-epimerase (non-hydrolyzing) [Streptosporangiaceae bacterium]
MSRRIAIVVGTRPEIIKLGLAARALGAAGRVVHTSQHQDPELAAVFFADARIKPELTLSGISGLPRHVQIARMIEQLGDVFTADPPAAVIVQGDTNTASAAAQAANYAGVPVIHVEAGLRSFDRAMPEEINRCLIAVAADVHCAPTELAVTHLCAAGVPQSRIELTGNTIVEATRRAVPRPAESAAIVRRAGVEPGQFVLATIHRPENTDDPLVLETILDQLSKIGLPVLLPLHPRTRLAAGRYGLTAALDRLTVQPPADRRTFLGLASLARLIVTDSGGIQEECTVLKRPLIVVRRSTERPESVAAGFSFIVGPGPQISDIGRSILADPGLDGRLASTPCPYGDGKASGRIAAIARRYLTA